jgi:hypothetical protein
MSHVPLWERQDWRYAFLMSGRDSPRRLSCWPAFGHAATMLPAASHQIKLLTDQRYLGM